jgi:hypothetical protein
MLMNHASCPTLPTATSLPVHLHLVLHLRVEVRHLPQLTASKHILPANLGVPALQNVPVHTTASAQRRRPPLAGLRDLELHAPTHRLGDTELPPQHLHLQPVLGVAPLDKAGLERVGGLESDGRC